MKTEPDGWEHRKMFVSIITKDADSIAEALIRHTTCCTAHQVAGVLLEGAGWDEATFMCKWMDGDFDE